MGIFVVDRTSPATLHHLADADGEDEAPTALDPNEKSRHAQIGFR